MKATTLELLLRQRARRTYEYSRYVSFNGIMRPSSQLQESESVPDDVGAASAAQIRTAGSWARHIARLLFAKLRQAHTQTVHSISAGALIPDESAVRVGFQLSSDSTRSAQRAQTKSSFRILLVGKRMRATRY